MPTISTKGYLLDQAKRRFTPSITNFPGMGAVERKLLATQFEPPQRIPVQGPQFDIAIPAVFRWVLRRLSVFGHTMKQEPPSFHKSL